MNASLLQNYVCTCLKGLFDISLKHEIRKRIKKNYLVVVARRDANSKSGHENLLFCQFPPKNCMKMKEIRPRGRTRVPGAPSPPLDPPMLYESPCDCMFFNV